MKVSKRIINFLACGALICLSGAQSPAATAPKLFCATSSFGFGKLTDTNVVIITFNLRNTGDDVLAIQKVRGCCGASASVTTNAIAPGTNAFLNIRFSLAGRSGPVAKSIYIHTSDPSAQIHQFMITGEVVAVSRPTQGTSAPRASIHSETVVIEPATVLFGELTSQSATNRHLTVRAGTEKNVSVLQVRSGNDKIKADFKEIEPKRKYEIVVSTMPPLPSGALRTDITLVVKDYSISQIHVPVFAVVHEEDASLPAVNAAKSGR